MLEIKIFLDCEQARRILRIEAGLEKLLQRDDVELAPNASAPSVKP